MRFKMPDLSDNNVRFRVLLYVGAIAIFGIFAASVAIPLLSNPSFCGKACHNMNPEYQTWRTSSHAQVTCYACHVNPTIPALLIEKGTAGPKGMIDTVFNLYEKPINPESEVGQMGIPAVRCKRCHANENRKFTFTRGIKMNHKAHKEAEIACTVCHNRVAHKGAGEFEPLKSWPEAQKIAEEEGQEHFKYKNFLDMTEGCFRCHSGSPESRDVETLKLIKNGKKPPAACSTCHTKDFGLPEGHENNNWRVEHAATAKKNFTECFRCHDAGAEFPNGDKSWCTLCHDDAKVKSFKAGVVP